MTDAAFPRSHRLLTAGDYRRVFNRVSYRVPQKNLLFLAAPNDLGHPRLGLVFAKKNLKKASQRNRIKRLARESFRHHKGDLPGMDIIVLGRQGLADLSNPDVTGLLNQAWRRLQKAAARPDKTSQA